VRLSVMAELLLLSCVKMWFVEFVAVILFFYNMNFIQFVTFSVLRLCFICLVFRGDAVSAFTVYKLSLTLCHLFLYEYGM